MLTYIPTQENSPNLGVSHYLEVMRHAHLHSHTEELTQLWCEPLPEVMRHAHLHSHTGELTQPWCKSWL